MPTTDVQELFRPTSASIRQLVADIVGGFAIPSYQRPYRWQPSDIKRLLEDLINGLDRLADDDRAVAFIGAIITVNGVSPTHQNAPQEARQIIDGQQRLSSLLMVAIATHERLRRVQPRIATLLDEQTDETAAEVIQYLIEQSAEVQKQLLDCLTEEKAFGDDSHRKLPKLVRDHVDIWSTRSESARYLSPIANLIHTYVQHCDGGAGSFTLVRPTVQVLPEAPGSAPEDHVNVERRFAQIRSYLGQVERGSEGDIGARIDLAHMLKPGASTLPALFAAAPTDALPHLRQLANDHTVVEGCVRLTLFGRFLLERVALTQINAKDESYAFDLFDSLNTTGEPLTALETFLPLVVEQEGIGNYPTSESFRHMSEVSKLLAAQDADIQVATARLITSFALADAGVKVANRHNDQRRELTKRYRIAAETMEQRRAMTHHLSSTALTFFRYWRDGRALAGLDDESPAVADQATKFCLRFLRNINHHIVIAPLTRYYAAFHEAHDVDAAVRLFEATKALTAFSVMWRAAHGGTDGIDGEYRRLMEQGRGDLMGRLARTPAENHSNNPLPSVDELKAALREVAGSHQSLGFADREEWVHRSVSRPIYSEQSELARFLLLLGAHHAVPEGTSGLTQDGTTGDHTSMLQDERWEDERVATVEHVAPQTPTIENGVVTGWPADCYATAGTIHSIGNLTLVPLDANVWLSNRSWAEKRYLYRALASSSPEEATAYLDEAATQGLAFSDQLKERVHERRHHLPVLQAVGEYEGQWSEEFIKVRGEHILHRSWAVMSGWLGY